MEKNVQAQIICQKNEYKSASFFRGVRPWTFAMPLRLSAANCTEIALDNLLKHTTYVMPKCKIISFEQTSNLKEAMYFYPAANICKTKFVY